MRLKTFLPAAVAAGMLLAGGTIAGSPTASAQELPLLPPLPAAPTVDSVVRDLQRGADEAMAAARAALSDAGIGLPAPAAPSTPAVPAGPGATAGPTAPATPEDADHLPVAARVSSPVDGAATADAALATRSAENPAADNAAPGNPAPGGAAADIVPSDVLRNAGDTPVLVESPIFVDEQGRPMLDVFRKPNGPNYTWAKDLRSQILALHRGEVLHRVDGSFFNAPAVPRESIAAQMYGKSLFGPGTPIYVGTENFCTLSLAGYDEAGNALGMTAGHCGNIGDAVYSADSWENGATGTVVAKSGATGKGPTGPFGDVAIIKFDAEKTALTRSYNGVTVNQLGGAPVAPFAQLCKMGVATGLTCGPQLGRTDAMALSHVCAMQGDSGAPLLAGDRFVGVVSGGLTNAGPCRTPLQGPLFVPVLSTTSDHIFSTLDNAEPGTVGRGFRLPQN